MAKNSASSYHTKKAIAESFLKLLVKMPIQKITVKEIVEGCGLNRQTFYYHFSDVYSLLNWAMKDMMSDLSVDAIDRSNWQSILSGTLHFMLDNRREVLGITRSIGEDTFQELVFGDLYDALRSAMADFVGDRRVDPRDLDMLAKFYTIAFIGTARDWVLGGMKQSPEEMLDFISKVVYGGIDGVLKMILSDA